MFKVVIFGGRNYKGYPKVKGIEIIHHAAWLKQKNCKRLFESLVKVADCVILFPEAISHQNMYDIKDLAKYYRKKILYPRGTGLKRAIDNACMYLRLNTIA